MENKIKKINFNHSFIFFLFCNIFSLSTFIFNNFTLTPLICLFLILSIGVSHGSLDNVKGEKLFKIFGINSLFIFYLSYILIAVVVIILWVLFPSISLVVFLIVASYHFGKEDTQFLVNEDSYLNQLFCLELAKIECRCHLPHLFPSSSWQRFVRSEGSSTSDGQFCQRSKQPSCFATRDIEILRHRSSQAPGQF